MIKGIIYSSLSWFYLPNNTTELKGCPGASQKKEKQRNQKRKANCEEGRGDQAGRKRRKSETDFPLSGFSNGENTAKVRRTAGPGHSKLLSIFQNSERCSHYRKYLHCAQRWSQTEGMNLPLLTGEVFAVFILHLLKCSLCKAEQTSHKVTRLPLPT